MANLSKYDALIAELEPYTAAPVTVRKALADAGMGDGSGSYDPVSDRRAVAVAAVGVLRKLIVLMSDSLGKSSQGYSVDMLRQRIHAVCRENGMDVSDFVEIPSVTDGSYMW